MRHRISAGGVTRGPWLRYNIRTMPRTLRPILAVLALLLLVAGTAFAVRNPAGFDHRSPVAASHQPKASGDVADENDTENEPEDDTDAQGGPPSAQLLAKLHERLSAVGLDTDDATLTALIEDNGVGGAVRLLAWADASGTSVADLQQMHADGTGWGEIAHQLDADGSLGLSPGIGWIMSGGHGHAADAHATTHGRDTAPGQNRP